MPVHSPIDFCRGIGKIVTKKEGAEGRPSLFDNFHQLNKLIAYKGPDI